MSANDTAALIEAREAMERMGARLGDAFRLLREAIETDGDPATVGASLSALEGLVCASKDVCGELGRWLDAHAVGSARKAVLCDDWDQAADCAVERGRPMLCQVGAEVRTCYPSRCLGPKRPATKERTPR